MDRHDVRVIQSGDSFGFPLEPLYKAPRCDRPAENKFYRYDAIETDLAGPKNHPHSPAPNFLEQFVITHESNPGQRRGVGAVSFCRRFASLAEQPLLAGIQGAA